MADLIKWNRDPFEDFDRMFDSLLPNVGSRRLLSNSNHGSNFMGFDMAVDVYEKNDMIIAEMNLPGIDPDQVSVEVEEGMLKISGERNSESTEGDESGNYHRREIRRGSFSRMVNLPETADTSTSGATYKDGVLKIGMKKLPESSATAKRLEIKRR